MNINRAAFTTMIDRFCELDGLLGELKKRGGSMSAPLSADPTDEMLEIVDKKGNIIGTASRGECHSSTQLLHQAVHVFVMDTKGRLFLQKRSLNKKIQPGKWDSSVGGHVDPGEGALEAAKREAYEELGITVSADELCFLHQYLWRSDCESELITSFKLHYEGEFQLSSIEIDEGRFYSRVELETLITSGMTTENFAYEYQTRLQGLLTLL